MSPPVGPGDKAPGKFLGILGYFRSTNAIYKALFVRKTQIIPFLISFLTLERGRAYFVIEAGAN